MLRFKEFILEDRPDFDALSADKRTSTEVYKNMSNAFFKRWLPKIQYTARALVLKNGTYYVWDDGKGLLHYELERFMTVNLDVASSDFVSDQAYVFKFYKREWYMTYSADVSMTHKQDVVDKLFKQQSGKPIFKKMIKDIELKVVGHEDFVWRQA